MFVDKAKGGWAIFKKNELRPGEPPLTYQEDTDSWSPNLATYYKNEEDARRVMGRLAAKQMRVCGSNLIASGNVGKRTFLSLHQLNVEHKDARHPYFMVTRGDRIVPPEEKKPDAVVVVGFCERNHEQHIVVVHEFRPAIGRREISFPAGMIDPSDYAGTATVQEAAAKAGTREFFEETGMSLEVLGISPQNIYSSAGMTDESSIFVFGMAEGEPHIHNNEETEDIEVELLGRAQLDRIIFNNDLAFSKAAWPVLWVFHKMGFFA